MLQWGHGEFAVDDYVPVLVRFSLDTLQWGHGEFAVDDRGQSPRCRATCSRFNGATANSPWMTALSQCGSLQRARCFNGATANSPWMTFLGREVGIGASRLQWGHGEFAVDDA